MWNIIRRDAISTLDCRMEGIKEVDDMEHQHTYILISTFQMAQMWGIRIYII